VALAIDDAGRSHIAADCGDEIRHIVWDRDAIDTHTDRFARPPDRVELGPQLAIDGDSMLMAYSRLAPTDGGCGDDGLEDLGVYVRTASLDDQVWSDPVRVGEVGDTLQSFRVVDGVLHLTVGAKDGQVYYESARPGGSATRVAIPDAVETSLRIGDDGHARIAYTTGQAIRYARIDGHTVQRVTVASSDETNFLSPSLVLAPGDVATILWTQDRDAGGGCASPGPGPLDGTYVGTDAGGSWSFRRVSKAVEPASLTLDPTSGRWHAIILAGDGLRYLTGGADGPISRATLPDGDGDYSGAVIRRDPTDGRLVVVVASSDYGIYGYTLP
jgi:hypothetical protein